MTFHGFFSIHFIWCFSSFFFSLSLFSRSFSSVFCIFLYLFSLCGYQNPGVFTLFFHRFFLSLQPISRFISVCCARTNSDDRIIFDGLQSNSSRGFFACQSSGGCIACRTVWILITFKNSFYATIFYYYGVACGDTYVWRRLYAVSCAG